MKNIILLIVIILSDVMKSKYNSLNDKYQALFSKEQERELNGMINFGYNIVDSESRISDDEKKKFIKDQIKEKCEKHEFTDNDAVKSFAITQIAVALYQNDIENNNSNKNDFCVDIVKEENKHVMSSVEKLRDANKKLNNI